MCNIELKQAQADATGYGFMNSNCRCVYLCVGGNPLEIVPTLN
jgi:hypothetical protein